MDDYKKYLSIDNGHGVLIHRDDAFILDRYHIDYYGCTSLKALIILIEECLEESYDDELEEVIEHLSETYYYQEVKKQVISY